jgi:hypothetical protein
VSPIASVTPRLAENGPALPGSRAPPPPARAWPTGRPCLGDGVNAVEITVATQPETAAALRASFTCT